MIEQLISYIAHQPSDSLSPLFLELNTTAMLAALGGPDSGVTIYDSNAQTANLPYVRLSDSGQRQRMETFLRGGYLEKQTLKCECVATGLTAASATNNAELLKLAIEGEVMKLKTSLIGVTTRIDLGGTSSTEQVVNIHIGSVGQETPVQGQTNEFLATRITLIDLMVFKGRAT